MELEAMAHACNPTTWEVDIRGSQLKSSSGKRSLSDPCVYKQIGYGDMCLKSQLGGKQK
jgi:hypothetical protein